MQGAAWIKEPWQRETGQHRQGQWWRWEYTHCWTFLTVTSEIERVSAMNQSAASVPTKQVTTLPASHFGVLVQVLSAPIPIQLLTKALGRATEDGLNT